jgi:hypothetical protein
MMPDLERRLHTNPPQRAAMYLGRSAHTTASSVAPGGNRRARSVGLVEFDQIARRIDYQCLIPEPLSVVDVVDRDAVLTYGSDRCREVVDLDREVRRAGERVGRLEQMYLTIAKLEPRAWKVSSIWSFHRLKTEDVTIERESRVRVSDHQSHVV